MIEQVLEGKLIALLQERLQEYSDSIAFQGSWQPANDGETKDIELDGGTISVSSNPIDNDQTGSHLFKMQSTVELLIPRSIDASAILRNNVSSVLLPFLRSFAGICNAKIKADLSGTDYTVQGVFDEASSNTYNAENDIWVVSKTILFKLTINQ